MRELGCASFEELYERVGSSEMLALWMAEFDLDPWGEQRLDLYFAQLTAAVANKGRQRGFVRPSQFVIRWDPHRLEEEAIADAESMFRGLAERLGGRIVE